MSFPTTSQVYKTTRTGVSDIVGLTPGEVYTVSLTKNGATARLLWNDRPGTSALDSEWTAMSELDAADEANLTAPPEAKAIAFEVTAVAPGVPRPAVSMTITSSASAALHGKAHALTGRHGGVAIGFVADEYNALVLADGADVFWPLDDGILTTLTNIGPAVSPAAWTDEQINNAPPVITENQPWPGVKSCESNDTRFRMLTATHTIDRVDEWGTLELWIRPISTASGRNIYMTGSDNGMIQFQDSPPKITTHYTSNPPALADPGAWTASTVYAQGDRARAAADNSRMAEAEVGGTSSSCEPTWPTDHTTVVDGTVTWRDCGLRGDFNNVETGARGGQGDPDTLWVADDIIFNNWYHVVCVRRANSNIAMYINGVKAYEMDVQPNNNIGTFGTPVPYQVDTAGFTASTTRWLGDNGFEEDEHRGRWSKFAVYQFTELTDAQILAHYNKGVELGLTG